jgi:DNA helicase II / ATP-dependent DNA helicase PcrA
MTMLDLRTRLSAPQYEAATQLDAPVCILAGAGSGKTRVITHRIAWLMAERRARPSSILAVTFTNKAAQEMRARIEQLAPQGSGQLWLGTFHGLAARMLRRYGDLVGVRNSFVIYDADDAHRLLQRIVENDLNLAKDTARPIGHLIDGWQSDGLSADDIPSGPQLLYDKAIQAYRIYQERLMSMGALDFGGLLLSLRSLLLKPEGAVITRAIRHVLVDEYQDVSQVQADIVLAVARGADSVAVVGDDDQAIYGWRGASADNLKRFLVALPGSVVIKLEDNYRSTQPILTAANGIITRNQVRLGKELRAATPAQANGRSVRVVKARDDLEEARKLMMLAVEHVANRTSLDEIAFLYRTNASSRLLEDELRRHQLPYRVIGGTRFYDRKEVKDVLATVRCALVAGSDVDFLRFMAAMPRGVGDTTVKKIDAVARQRRTPLRTAFADESLMIEAGLTAAMRSKCKAIATILDGLARKIGRAAGAQNDLFAQGQPVGARDAMALAIDASGLADKLAAEGDLEAEGRLENLLELKNAAALFEEQNQRLALPADIEAFLEAAALTSSVDETKEDDGRGKITLMTLHAAKGLEFEVVFITGWEDGGFPHARAIGESGDASQLEEERRLAYVGITRAKKRLVLSWAQHRMVNGARRHRDMSRFLQEIPREALDGDVPPRARNYDDDNDPRSASMLDLWRQRNPRRAPADEDIVDGPRVVYDAEAVAAALSQDEPMAPPVSSRRFSLRSSLQPAPEDVGLDDSDSSSLFRSGSHVWHKRFGDGVVVGMRGAGHGQAALVRFDGERQPQVILVRHLRASSASP